jgi:hypothetical protein
MNVYKMKSLQLIQYTCGGLWCLKFIYYFIKMVQKCVRFNGVTNMNLRIIYSLFGNYIF